MSNLIEIIRELYPLHRTLNSDDNQLALNIVGKYLDDGIGLVINEYSCGSKVWTWRVPKRFHVNYGYLKDLDGNILIDFQDNPLHLVSYSVSVNKTLSFDELKEHLYFNELNPDSIPWVYKYYNNEWGFCLTKNFYGKLDKNCSYKVEIDTEFIDKPMVAGEVYLPGFSDKEILLVVDICHPYQANDSISGVAVAIEIINNLSKKKNFLSLRVLFVPETIGTIAWLATNEVKIKNIICGICFDCLGNNNKLNLQKSLYGDNYIDFLATSTCKSIDTEINISSFTEHMAHDETVLSSPGIEIPTISFNRAPYKEYHTSADSVDIIKAENLFSACGVIEEVIKVVMNDYIPCQNQKGIIFLSGYNLWIDEKENLDLLLKRYMILQYINGNHSVFEISKLVDINFHVLCSFLDKLFEEGLIQKIDIDKNFMNSFYLKTRCKNE